MSIRAEETVPWPHPTIFAIIAAGVWLFYRHYAAAVERLQRREEVPFGDLRVVQKGEDPKFEIIAVQGLGSHPDRTWKSKEKNDEVAGGISGYPDLLKDLLPARFKHARITRWAYNSDWDHDGSVASLPDYGRDFLRQLNTHLEYYKEEGMMLPVIFLGHSFGGLVIKEAFVAASDDSSVWRATRGIIFLGTPHMGSSLWRFAAVQAFFNRLLGSNLDLAGAISLHNDHLKHLKDQFNERLSNDLSKAVRIVSISEAKPVYLFRFFSLKLVVDHHSSEEHAHERIRWTCGHTELNKFRGIDDQRFRELAKQIQRITPSYILRTADEKIQDVCYADEKLRICRISGHRLDFESCYINLGLIQILSKGHKDSESMDAQSPNHTLMSRLRLEEPENGKRKKLTSLFDPVTINNVEIEVRRVLIYGRAGIGKSTLCKKIVDEFRKKEIWRDKFDRLLWIPLRDIKGVKAGKDALKTVLDHIFFNDYDPDNKLAEKMSQQLRLEKFDRTLFLLDGLDEVISDFGGPGSKTILRMLVNLPNVVVTSRPHFRLPEEINAFDIETEVLGFTTDQVNDYIEKSGCDAPDDIRKFLKANKFVHDLVRIPIQLDALCYTWDSMYGKEPPRTMTELYQALQMKLAQKDLERNDPQHENNTSARTENDVREESESATKLLMALAFSGMCLNEVNFDGSLRDMTMNSFGPKFRVGRTTEILQRLSFLRPNTGSYPETSGYTTYHFLHLTYQEYFAAQYFVRQWQENKPLVILSKKGRRSFRKSEVTIEEFLIEKKYSPTLDVFWRFVCGLLPESNQVDFFRLVGQNPDILGLTHQRLIMHCLAEASLNLTVREQLESEIKNWAYFELSWPRQYSTLAAEADFPESAVDHILSNRSFMLRFKHMKALLRRQSLSNLALTQIFIRTYIENPHSDLQWVSYLLLTKFKLPKDLVDQMLERTRDPNTTVALDCSTILWYQQESLVPLGTIERHVQSSDEAVSWRFIKLLRDYKSIPDVLSQAIISWRHSTKQKLRVAAICTLIYSSGVDAKILEEIITPLEDDGIGVFYALMDFFAEQEALTPKMLRYAVRNLLAFETQGDTLGFLFDFGTDGLFHRHGGALGPVYTTLQSSGFWIEGIDEKGDTELLDSLPSDVIREIVHCMQGDDDVDIRRKAFWILASEESLDQEVLAVLTQSFQALFHQIGSRFTSYEDFRSRKMLSTDFLLSLRPLVEDKTHHLHDQAIQVLKSEIIPDGTLERLIPAFEDFHTIDRDLLEICYNFDYLPKRLEESLVSLLDNPEEYVQWESGQILGNQSSIRLTSLAAIVSHLKGQSERARLSAIQAVKGLKLLPDCICDVFCELLEQHEETRVPICEVLERADDLNENLPNALFGLFEDDNPVVRENALRLFRYRKRGTVPISTLKCAIWKFRQCYREGNQSLRISMASAIGAHIANTELAPTFIKILCKDTAEVQIGFLKSFVGEKSITNRAGEELLPLFDTYYHDIWQRVDLNKQPILKRVEVQRLLVQAMRYCGEETITRKIALKMIQLLDHDDPGIKVAAGKILARHESDEYLHIFARLLRDPFGEVIDMAYVVLKDLPENSKLPADCLDVLRGLLSDQSIHDRLKKRVFKIFELMGFDHRTKSAQDLLVQVIPFLKSEKFCENVIPILNRFDNLSGLNMGYNMLKVPFERERYKVFELFLSRCKTEELKTLLNDLDQTIPFYRTALHSSCYNATSMHFINENDIQINTSADIKIIRIQNPDGFLAKIQKVREEICQESCIEPLPNIESANLTFNCDGKKISYRGGLVTI